VVVRPPIRPPVVVVAPPPAPVLVTNPAPVISVAANVQVVNPAATGVTLNYTLDNQAFNLASGSTQEIGRQVVIAFDRGNGLGTARYTLSDGVYTFAAAADGGWDLSRTN
jgi:hypothetical protein